MDTNPSSDEEPLSRDNVVTFFSSLPEGYTCRVVCSIHVDVFCLSGRLTFTLIIAADLSYRKEFHANVPKHAATECL